MALTHIMNTTHPQLYGLHHVTAVTAHASRNLDFYTRVLGLRLVKKTVNQDDVSAYHLFYADAVGTPGTDMTFFDWEGAGEREEGSDQISRTYFRVTGGESIAYWNDRLREEGIATHTRTLDTSQALLFEDFEGQRLGLVDDEGKGNDAQFWKKGGVPKEHALRGFYAIELEIGNSEELDLFFQQILFWKVVSDYTHPLHDEPVRVYEMGDGGPGAQVHVRSSGTAPVFGTRAGAVHHSAFRVRTHEEIESWLEYFQEKGIPNSGIVERYYFSSLYFRISPGILFEIATDGPGFSVDEDAERLGESLALPPFLESQREEIEAGLKPL